MRFNSYCASRVETHCFFRPTEADISSQCFFGL
jgi:hypothetical protein